MTLVDMVRESVMWLVVHERRQSWTHRSDIRDTDCRIIYYIAAERCLTCQSMYHSPYGRRNTILEASIIACAVGGIGPPGGKIVVSLIEQSAPVWSQLTETFVSTKFESTRGEVSVGRGALGQVGRRNGPQWATWSDVTVRNGPSDDLLVPNQTVRSYWFFPRYVVCSSIC